METFMDESRYLQLVSVAFRRIDDALADVDPSDVEVESAGDVLSLLLRNGVKVVVNTQRPTRQIWLAAKVSAFHFSYDEERKAWLDAKTKVELFATLRSIVEEGSGISPAL